MLIVSPQVAEAQPLHEVRLYNLTDFLEHRGWEVLTFALPGDGGDVQWPDQWIDKVVLIERSAVAMGVLRSTLSQRYRIAQPYTLDWTDLDDDPLSPGHVAALSSRGTEAQREEVAAPPSPAETPLAPGVPPESDTWPAREPRDHAAAERDALRAIALVAFEGDPQPRALPPSAVVAPDGSFMATLDAGDLTLYRPDGVPRRLLPGWAESIGLDTPARVLAVGRRWGHIDQVIVSNAVGTFSAISADGAVWLLDERVGGPAAAGALVDGTIVLVDEEGSLFAGGAAVSGLSHALATIAGLDTTARGATSCVLAWGIDRAGRNVARLLLRSRRGGEWMPVRQIDDVVRAGIERTPSSASPLDDCVVWVVGGDGESRRERVGES